MFVCVCMCVGYVAENIHHMRPLFVLIDWMPRTCSQSKTGKMLLIRDLFESAKVDVLGVFICYVTNLFFQCHENGVVHVSKTVYSINQIEIR